MKLVTPLIGLLVSLLFLHATSARSSDARVQPDLVVPLDTFSLSLYGYDSLNNGDYVVQPLTATFGTTQTFFSSGAGGAQNVTVSSSSVLDAGTMTDTIMVTVPVNFVPTGTITAAGNPFTFLELDLGGFSAGTNTIDFLTPVNSPTFAGSVLYRTNSVLTLSGDGIAANSIFTNNNSSLATVEAVESGTNDISRFAVHGFVFSITYTDVVPEPSAYVFVLAGGLLAGTICWRHRQWRAEV